MKKIFLVTGNAGKLAEWRRLVPAGIKLESADIDVTEIQSADPLEIVTEKAKRAYEIVGQPVVVEDVSMAIDSLGGMPGPFVKFFLGSMGNDALYKLVGKAGEPATVSCSIACYDGQNLITATGEVAGTIVAPRGDSGFGFDSTFMPSSGSKTLAEMTEAEKDAVSHRALAIAKFSNKL